MDKYVRYIYIYTIYEYYYSAMRQEETLLFATKQMDFEGIMLSEISQTEKYCMISLTCGIYKREQKGDCQELRGRGIGMQTCNQKTSSGDVMHSIVTAVQCISLLTLSLIPTCSYFRSCPLFHDLKQQALSLCLLSASLSLQFQI